MTPPPTTTDFKEGGGVIALRRASHPGEGIPQGIPEGIPEGTARPTTNLRRRAAG